MKGEHRTSTDPSVGDHVLWYEQNARARMRLRRRMKLAKPGEVVKTNIVWKRRIGIVVSRDHTRLNVKDVNDRVRVVCRWHVSAVGTLPEIFDWLKLARLQLHPWELRIPELREEECEEILMRQPSKDFARGIGCD